MKSNQLKRKIMEFFFCSLSIPFPTKISEVCITDHSAKELIKFSPKYLSNFFFNESLKWNLKPAIRLSSMAAAATLVVAIFFFNVNTTHQILSYHSTKN